MSAGDRIITAATFIVLGPLVGTLWVLCVMLGVGVLRGGLSAFSGALESFPALVLAGYVGGFLPASLTGGGYALLPARWQRVIVGLLTGAGVTWLLWELFSTALPGQSPPLTYIMMVGAGASAAAVSAFVARTILRSFGRTRADDGGIGG